MREDWSQTKLSANTQQTLSNIFRELDSNNIQQAFDMHVTLVRNASSEVRSLVFGDEYCVFSFRWCDLLWESND